VCHRCEAMRRHVLGLARRQIGHAVFSATQKKVGRTRRGSGRCQDPISNFSEAVQNVSRDKVHLRQGRRWVRAQAASTDAAAASRNAGLAGALQFLL
jgi:hypothetical protein